MVRNAGALAPRVQDIYRPFISAKKTVLHCSHAYLEKAAEFVQKHPLASGLLCFIAAPIAVLAAVTLIAVGAGGLVMAFLSVI